MLFSLIRFLQTSSNTTGAVNKKLLASLRQKTGYPILQCRKALDRFNNDHQAAEEWLKDEATKQGWAKMEKLTGRPMSQGLVGILQNVNTAILVEVNCETDFVARTPVFHKLVHSLAHSCVEAVPSQTSRCEWTSAELETLREPESGLVLADMVAKTVGELGEKVAIRRGIAMTATSPRVLVGSYSHAPWHDAPNRIGEVELGRYAALARIKLASSTPIVKKRELDMWSRQLCQHIIGLMPTQVGVPGVDTPHNNREEEKLLLFQDFLLDESKTVGSWLFERGLTIEEFVRWEYGEVLPGDE